MRASHVAVCRTPRTRAAPVVESTTASAPDVADQLVKLASLRDAGVLTEAEFAAKKTELLSRM